MRYFPLFIDTRRLPVLVIGGGALAEVKLRLLLRTDAQVSVIARKVTRSIEAWSGQARLAWASRDVTEHDLDSARLIYVATDSAADNRRIAAAARAAGALVNLVDDRDASTVLTPAIVDRDPVVVAIGTEGNAPVLARLIKGRLEAWLSPRLGALARLAGSKRETHSTEPAARRQALARFFDGAGELALSDQGETAAAALLDALLDIEPRPSAGRVALVGAGPGDPELLTLKARKRLDAADVVFHDRLVDPAILELARREARLIEVGKTPNGPAWSQGEINAAMIEAARAGAFVVRLKGGDPLIFGRADEEIEALEAAGIDYEIVPGITAAVAAAAAARFSLTRRGRNKAISFLTAHDAKGFAEHDWRALARPGEAFAIYMGVRGARFVQGRLLIHGASAATPVTIVENASRPDQKVITATLGRLTEALAEAGITGPAIIFVGLASNAALAALDDGPAAALTIGA
jgi:uroporphyrin-III C-methyltransferase/precorrin-2 dehydrogenase/sirohydrochlorin ferrochelatase